MGNVWFHMKIHSQHFIDSSFLKPGLSMEALNAGLGVPSGQFGQGC